MIHKQPASPLDAAGNPGPTSFLTRCGQAWDRFFFSPADPATLGMIRICCGLIVSYTLVAFSLDLQTFFGKDAWVDLPTRNLERQLTESYPESWTWGPTKEMPEKGMPVWSIWFHVTDPTAMTIVHNIFLLAAILFTLGLCTRITSAVTWFAMLSYINRSPWTIFGVDTMTAICLLYLMIGPSGAALSLDRLIWRWWVTYRSLRRGGDSAYQTDFPGKTTDGRSALTVEPLIGANLAIRLLQIHLCIIYMAAGLAKLQGRSWWEGNAVWGTIANFEFAPMHQGWYMAFLEFLAKHRFFWELFVTTSTIFTLVFEIGFAFLIWPRRTRWVILTMAVMLHGGIGLFMGLKTFSMIMLTMVMAFVAPQTIHRLLGALARGPGGLKLSFLGTARGSVRAASVVRALDIWSQVELVAWSQVELVDRSPPVKEGAPGEIRTEPLTSDGRIYRGWSIWTRLLVTLGIFRIFSPWCWVTAPWRRPAAPTFPASPAATLAGPVSLRGTSEPAKTAVARGKAPR